MSNELKSNLIGKEGMIFLLDNTCRVTISNRMPAAYKVTIIGAGVVFHYRDGGIRNEVNNNLALTSNQVYDFFNLGDGNKCVYILEALIKARLDETGDIVPLYQKFEGPPAKCITDMEFGIRPKRSAKGMKENSELELYLLADVTE